MSNDESLKKNTLKNDVISCYLFKLVAKIIRPNASYLKKSQSPIINQLNIEG